jgi:uncharacterized protein (TIGR00369 family)
MTLPSAQELQDFLLRSFPTPDGVAVLLVEDVGPKHARVRMRSRAMQLRPGQSVSGPAQMALADTVAWLHVLANLGFDAAPSVTSSLNINFLARPHAADLVAEGQLLKLGKRLSVSDVQIRNADSPQLVAQATVTYAVFRASAHTTTTTT